MTNFINRFIVRLALNCHNISYRIAGLFSQATEHDRLHPKHRLTDYHRWFIEQLHPEWGVLDVGCGNGALTVELSQHCRQVVGIDICPAVKEKTARQAGNVEFIYADAKTYVFQRHFDAIILSNVLEHIEDRVGFLKKLTNHSKRFLIRVPMIDRDWITLYKREIGVEYRLDPGHFTEYTLEGFVQELDAAGLKVNSYRIRYGEIYAVAGTK